MFTKKRLLVMTVAAFVAVTAALAQTPGRRGERFKAFIASYLDLTEAQKEQAKTIFEAARAQAEPMRAGLRDGHKALADAVKANASEIELEHLAKAQGDAMGQMTAIHAKAMAKFYQTLTPAQKEKAQQLHDRIKDRLSERFSHRR